MFFPRGEWVGGVIIFYKPNFVLTPGKKMSPWNFGNFYVKTMSRPIFAAFKKKLVFRRGTSFFNSVTLISLNVMKGFNSETLISLNILKCFNSITLIFLNVLKCFNSVTLISLNVLKCFNSVTLISLNVLKCY